MDTLFNSNKGKLWTTEQETVLFDLIIVINFFSRFTYLLIFYCLQRFKAN